MFISKFDISMLKSIKSWKVQAPSQGKPLMEPFCKRIPATMQQHSANILFICSCRDYFKKRQIIDVKIFTISSFYQGSFWIKKCYTLILEITNVFSLKILEHITIFLCFHFQVSSNFNLITYIKMDWITGQSKIPMWQWIGITGQSKSIPSFEKGAKLRVDSDGP